MLCWAPAPVYAVLGAHRGTAARLEGGVVVGQCSDRKAARSRKDSPIGLLT
jgi:hypothetical protein